MRTNSSPSGPGPLIWVVAVVAIVGLAYLGWRSNQAGHVAAPGTAPAAAPAEAQQQNHPPAPTEPNGSAAG